VPCEHAHAVASLRVYPFELAVVVGEAESPAAQLRA
jgi:hypothetical protein